MLHVMVCQTCGLAIRLKDSVGNQVQSTTSYSLSALAQSFLLYQDLRDSNWSERNAIDQGYNFHGSRQHGAQQRACIRGSSLESNSRRLDCPPSM